jgi:hypothetical protein
MTTVNCLLSANTYLWEDYPTYIVGSQYYLSTGKITTGYYRTVIRIDFSSLGASRNITGANLRMTTDTTSAVSFDIAAYRLLKPWVEMSATWNRYAAPSSNWSTPGMGSSTDYYATALGSVAMSSAIVPGTKISIPLNAEEIQKQYDGTYRNALISLTSANYTSITFYSSTWTTEAQRPYVEITYADAPGAGVSPTFLTFFDEVNYV